MRYWKENVFPFSLQILANNRLDALFMYLFIYFVSLHVSSIKCSSSGDRIVSIHHLVWLVCVSECLVCRSGGNCKAVLIIRRSNCINTSSGMISVYKWMLGMPVRRELQSSSLLTGIPSIYLHRLIIPDDVLIKFDLLMMALLCSSLLTGIPSIHLHRLIIPHDILIKFDLLMMSTWCSKHVERWNK